MLKFDDIVLMTLCRRCYNGGESITDIAKTAKRSKAKVRQWIKDSGVPIVHEKLPKQDLTTQQTSGIILP